MSHYQTSYWKRQDPKITRILVKHISFTHYADQSSLILLYYRLHLNDMCNNEESMIMMIFLWANTGAIDKDLHETNFFHSQYLYSPHSHMWLVMWVSFNSARAMTEIDCLNRFKSTLFWSVGTGYFFVAFSLLKSKAILVNRRIKNLPRFKLDQL